MLIDPLVLYAQKIDYDCNKGIAEYEAGNYEAAIPYFDKCIKSDKKDAAAYFNRGNAYMQLDQPGKGLKDLEKAIKLKPDMEIAYNTIALYYLTEKDLDGAIEWLDQIVTQFPEDPFHYNFRGWLYFSFEKYPQAFTDFSMAIQLDSNYASAYNNRGSCRYKMQDIADPTKRDLEQARDDYYIALALDPKLPGIQRNLGYIHLLLEEYETALGFLKTAAEQDPEDPIVPLYTGQVYQAMGNFPLALDAFDNGLAKYADLGGALWGKANVYFEMKDYSSAINMLNKATQVADPYPGKAHYLLAKIMAIQSNWPEVIPNLKKSKSFGYFEEGGRIKELKKEEAFRPLLTDPVYKKFLEDL